MVLSVKLGVTCKNLYPQKMGEQATKLWIVGQPASGQPFVYFSTRPKVTPVFKSWARTKDVAQTREICHAFWRTTSFNLKMYPHDDSWRWGVCYCLGHIKCECLGAKLIQLVNDKEDVRVPRMWCKWIWDVTARCWSRSTLEQPFLG